MTTSLIRTVCLALASCATAVVPLAAAAQEVNPALNVDAADESQVPRTVATDSAQPRGAFPPPPPHGDARFVSGTFLAGPGWLALRDDLGREGQQATSLAGRLGLVVGPEWNLTIAVEHTRTSRGGATFSQTAMLMGLQRFLLERLYLGGALGLAWVRESGVADGLIDGPGGTASAHLGIEVHRSSHTAMTAEVSFTLAQYPKEQWEMGGVRLGLLLF